MNFKFGDMVQVRDDHNGKWEDAIFGSYVGDDRIFPFRAITELGISIWTQCRHHPTKECHIVDRGQPVPQNSLSNSLSDLRKSTRAAIRGEI